MAAKKEVFSAYTEDGRALHGEELDKALKEKVARVLSDILSDKYDCDITVSFVPKVTSEQEKEF